MWKNLKIVLSNFAWFERGKKQCDHYQTGGREREREGFRVGLSQYHKTWGIKKFWRDWN